MSNKRKRVALSVEQKLEIIKRRDKNESVTSLANEFGMGQQTVRDIVKNRIKLENFLSKCETFVGAAKRKSLKCATYEDLDNVMIKWFLQERASGTPVSDPIIINKARFFCEQLKIPETFKISSGWLKRFKQRYGIRTLEIQDEELSDDYVAATLFCDELDQIIEEKSLVPAQIYNAGETGLYWRAMPTRTLAYAQEQNAPDYKIKDRITVLCCGNASGEDKLKLAVIGKSKSRSLRNETMLPVDYYNHPSAWMNREIFKTWFKDKFVPYVKNYLTSQKLPLKAILLLDNAPSHPSADELNAENGNFSVVYLPPNVTSLIQPMDQGVIETMKKLYRKTVMMDLITADKEAHSFWKSLTIKDAIYNVATAWQNVKNETIERSFKNVLPENFGSREYMETSNGTEEILILPDLLHLIQNIRGCEEVNEGNINKWLCIDQGDLGFEQFNDEDLIQSVRNESTPGTSNPQEDRSDNEDLQPAPNVTCEDALTAAETLLKFMESQDDTGLNDILQIRGYIRKIKTKQLQQKRKQTKITNYILKQ